jgi:hypothetical protein
MEVYTWKNIRIYKYAIYQQASLNCQEKTRLEIVTLD